MMSRALSAMFAPFAFAVMLAVTPALAQQNAAAPITPSHQAAAVEVLKASGMNTIFQNALPNAVAGIRQQVTRQRPELTRDIEASLAEVEKQVPEVINDGLGAAARFIAQRMSEDELKDVYKFLSSPVGKKYVDVLPGFMDDVMPFLQNWSQAAGAAMNEVFRSEMQKRGHTL